MTMKKYLLQNLVSLGIYSTTPLKNGEDENADNILVSESGHYIKVNTDEVSREEIQLALECKKIEEITNIKKMVKFFYVWAIICIAFDLFWFLYLLGEGISLIEVIASMF